MSIFCISKVWAFSRARSGTLLVLLAIADFADDQGYAYPSNATLATKARIDERSVRRVVADLVKTGELSVFLQAGPHGCNLYRVNIEKLAPCSSTSPTAPNRSSVDLQRQESDKNASGGKHAGGTKTTEGEDKNDMRGGQKRPQGRTPTSPEPSENHQRIVTEPSRRPPAKLLSAEASAYPARCRRSLPELPANASPELRTAWTDWLQHRRELGKPLTPVCAVHQLGMIGAWGDSAAVAAIRQSLKNGWLGLFPVRNQSVPMNREKERNTTIDPRFADAF